MSSEQELAYFRATRRLTLTLIEGLGQRQLDHRPVSGGWSIGEIADHIRLAETFNRGDLERLIELALAGREPVVRQTLEVVDISVFSIPKSVFARFEAPLDFLGRFLPAGFRNFATLTRWVKLQNPSLATPRPCRPKSELVAGLRDGLRVTENLLRRHPDLDYPRMTFVQPLLGGMNALELLHWMALHEQRHQMQIHEVKQSRDFPETL